MTVLARPQAPKRPEHALPAAGRVLAVCAHPDDESFGLGGILGTYADQGVGVGVLCLTRGEASTLAATDADLATARTAELACASRELGVGRRWHGDYPDGELAGQPLAWLVDEVRQVLTEYRPDLVVAFDPDGITGHPDHQRATRAAVSAADGARLPVLAWYVPAVVADTVNAEFGTDFVATTVERGSLHVAVDRRRQRRAISCHRSQRGARTLVERRLELLGSCEHLRPLTAG